MSGWARSRGRRASIPGSSGGRTSTAAGVLLALSSTEGGWTTRRTAPPRAGLFAPPGRASKARHGSGTPAQLRGSRRPRRGGHRTPPGPRGRAGPQLGRLATAPTGRRPPPGTAGTTGEAPPEGLVCAVIRTGARYGKEHAPSRGKGAHDDGRMPLNAPGAGRGGGHGADGNGDDGGAGPPEDGGRAARLLPGPGPLGDGAVTDHGEDDDADGGDGGPDD